MIHSKADRFTNKILTTLIVVYLLFSVSNSYAEVATLTGNVLSIPVVKVLEQAFTVNFTLVADSDPIEMLVVGAEELVDADLEGASSFDGLTLAVPSILVDGVSYHADFYLQSEDPLVFVLISGAENGTQPPDPQSCQRPPQDLSNGPDNPTVVDGSSIPNSMIFDGGPGPDGIPPLDSPIFTQNFSGMAADELVVGIKIGDDIRAYPHRILDYHEVVNDKFNIGGEEELFTLSYCPLTGSAMLWKGSLEVGGTSFGTSGLLFNSNLVLYDRRTSSLWSQMLEQAVRGPELLTIPGKLPVVETTWGTWSQMYPQTTLLTEDTGFLFPYGTYPYGPFKTNNFLIAPANNTQDTRLHKKERVLGINVGASSKVYPVDSFALGISAINDRVGDMDVIATGSSSQNFAVVFNRQLEDCTTLDFSAVENQMPVILIDNEGNHWDIFGTAVSGPRAGTQLQKTNSYIAYWYSWTAFFPNSDIQP